MRWYNHLYLGKKAKRRRYTIIRNLREGKFMPGIHVITPSQNGNNILDIYPAFMLSLYPDRDPDLLILGIAADYREAMEVVRIIIDEMYRTTGDLKLEFFLEKKEQ